MTKIIRAAALGLLLTGAAFAGEGSATLNDGHVPAPMPAPWTGVPQTATQMGSYMFNTGLQGQS